MRTQLRLLLVAAMIGVASCDDTLDPDEATYTIEVEGERFHVRVNDAQVAARLEDRMRTGTIGVILGRVATGNDGYNEPWSWHLVPNTIEVPDLAIELCDGTPSMVEADLNQWIAQVRNYCPWGAKVVSRN